MVNRVMSSLVDARTLLQKPDRPVAVAMHAVLNAKQQDCTAVIWSYTCLAVALPPCAPERHRLDRASPRPLFLPDKGRNTASKSRRVRSHSSLSTSAVVREAKAPRTPTRAARTLTTQRQARCPSSIHLFSTSAVWHKANPASILVCRLSSAGHVPLPSAHQGPSQQASKARKRPWRLSRRRRDVRKEADRSSGIFCNPCDDGNRPGPPCLDYLPYEGAQRRGNGNDRCVPRFPTHPSSVRQIFLTVRCQTGPFLVRDTRVARQIFARAPLGGKRPCHPVWSA